MKTNYLVFAFALGAALTLSLKATHNPAVDIPFLELVEKWNPTNEPAFKGGATRVEETIVRDGKISKSKYIMTLDKDGRPIQKDLVTEGSKKNYRQLFAYKHGKVAETSQTIKEDGKDDITHKKSESAFDRQGALTEVTFLQRLTKPELQYAGRLKITKTADGSKYVLLMKSGRAYAEYEFTFGKEERASRMTIKNNGQVMSVSLTRDKHGNIVKGKGSYFGGEPASFSIVYEYDDRGNWTKATFTQEGKTLKSWKKQVIHRKITY